MDYQATLYNPIYEALGVPAVLVPDNTNGEVALTVIDKTKGVEIPQADGIQLQTVKPAATARMVEVLANGITVDDVDDATITFNDKSWRIVSHLMKPSPKGEDDGEVQFILAATDESA